MLNQLENLGLTKRSLWTLSTGAKLMVVGVMALVMSLGALFEDSLVDERTGRRSQAVKEVSALSGGAQTFLGPVIMVPYVQRLSVPAGMLVDKASAHEERRGIFIVFPDTAHANFTTHTEERRRSLFRVPVYQTDATFRASFTLNDPNLNAPDTQINWDAARLVVGVTDLRGALGDVVLTLPDGGKIQFTPSALPRPVVSPKEGDKLSLIEASAPSVLNARASFDVMASLRFSGAERIAVLPSGRTTSVSMASNWGSPGFDGGVLPAERTVSKTGFRAEWSVPSIARNLPSVVDMSSVGDMRSAEMGVSFVPVATPYQSMTRALKYAPLFLGLVFLTYFLFEVTTKQRLHLAQYLLVGLAQTIFYLLLLSFAEHAGFDIAFALAGGATVALLSINVVWVFRSRLQGLRAAGIFGGLYTTIYLLLRLEDNALLVGAVGSFTAVGLAMYLTRNIDWFGSGTEAKLTTPDGAAFRVGEL